ncbi:hypothetical protein ACZ90_14645 [Streptomyces albus subsp. albus]|nr:hypothetical protein ACZ90_14645 [Streptomyces albus subsp. albus]
MPSISPAATGSPVYTVYHSKGLVADLRLAVGVTPPFPFLAVRFPADADAAQVTLVRGTTSLALLPDPGTDSTTFSHRQVIAEAVEDGSDIVLGVEIRATSTASAGEVWSVRAQAASPQAQWQFTQPDNAPGDLTVTRIMCDPAAGFAMSAPAPAGGQVTLTAVPARGTTSDPTVVGAPAPITAYRWSKSGGVTIPDFPVCSAGPQGVFTMPVVYTPKTIEISEEVWFETGCPGPVGMLSNSSGPQTLDIRTGPQHLALVLDRSGSMSGQRWQNATTAAQILGNLFVAMRTGVNLADRIEQLVFEDTSCSWHPNADPVIHPVLPASDLGTAGASICAVDYGPAGSCTPIGDGLIRAIDDLAALPVQDDAKYTIVLLTDGYENSGSVRVSPSTPLPAGASGIPSFAVARQTGTARQRVHQRLSLYTIGLGGTVQEDVLDSLAAQSKGVYRHVVQVSQVADAMAQMAASSHTAERVPSAPDPQTPPGRLVTLEPRVNRLAVAVLWTDPAHTVELAWRPLAATDPFTVVPTAVKQCPTHGFATVDLASLFGGEESVPATQWRIRHQDGAGNALPLADTDLLVFVDLFVRVQIVFDRTAYGTGDSMTITARIRAGDDPVTSATVTVELVRPEESLGTFLAADGAQYRPSHPTGHDPHAPKARMLTDLLRAHEMGDGLPLRKPTAIFEDGSNRLFDDGAHHDGEAGNGDFANRYVKADKEGTYTWRFVIAGKTPDGSAFSRVLTVSRWVGITPDPENTRVQVDQVPSPAGRRLTRITVHPRDRNGEFLGPFRPEDVLFASSTCPFQAAEQEHEPDSDGVRYPCRDGGTILSRYDGGYSRVLDCPTGTPATVTVTVRGVRLPPIVLGGND